MNKTVQNMTFEVKGMEDEKEFFTIEFIASTPDIDHAGDIVTSDAMQKSVEKYGLPKFLNGHKQSDFPLGVITEFKMVGNASVFKAQIPKVENDPFTSRLIALLKMKAFGGTSIGFFTEDSEWKDGVRVIKEIQLIEVSLVSIPCNQYAEVLGVKARELGADEDSILEMEKAFNSIITKEQEENKIELNLDSLKDIEKTLKEFGFTNKQSKTIVSKIAELKKLSDSADEDEARLQKELEIEEQKKLSDSADLKSVNDFFTNLIENK
jgi:HK97 family phage prohead protease